ncbi:hypothetical protein M409DRAFT_35960 [Zasmidium cellare ATCC 36951]|uniref:Gfo/Idh/MocA-like oxidoreductase N-terminal domain-containing protein n=1 Tax=Zasmidium cellare ATCC 36951 TaxID=1080233 RepID=A0A6A6CUE6_ZASCE|nr:uncharacterized protein M409DRAFT_35960 [Zasmidium cellare ATCC 36951]KAF2170333.1 hypothetical protein M409DRAFT_35960 [Zasmidium cellare ATCC 36951]
MVFGIALLGAGTYPKQTYLAPLHSVDAKLVAVYSRSRRSAADTAEEAKKLSGFVSSNFDLYHDEESGPGLDDLLKRDDVHAVVISLPTLVQPGLALKALAAGKHVVMEKPIAKDVQASQALIAEHDAKYKSKGLILSIMEQYRFDEGHDNARQIVTDGTIGDLTAVHARVWNKVSPGNKYYETEWRKKPEYQGGFLLDGGVHFVSLIRHIAADEIVETVSFAKQTLDHLPPLDTVQAALKLKSGALGTLSISFASAKRDFSYVFIGSKGSLVLTRDPNGTKLIVEDDAGNAVSEEIVSNSSTYKNLFAAFLDDIQAGKSDERGSPQQALADVAVVESICSGGGSVKYYPGI